jgi:hypothetical protein
MVVGAMAIVGVAAIVLGLVRATQEPDIVLPATTPADGLRAQQKLYDLLRGPTRGGAKELVLTENELNAFLSRHLADAAELPLTGLVVKLVDRDVIDFVGRVPSRHILAELPLASLRDFLPARWLDQPVWLSIRARFGVERGASRERRRYLRLDVERFALGRQRLPSVFVRLVFSPATLRVLRWQLPETVESLTAESGRVVIRTASSR